MVTTKEQIEKARAYRERHLIRLELYQEKFAQLEIRFNSDCLCLDRWYQGLDDIMKDLERVFGIPADGSLSADWTDKHPEAAAFYLKVKVLRFI